jgi:hypothetical protein
MKNKELYDKTISILVKAYLNDTLLNGFCSACAVGNIIAENNGLRISHRSLTMDCWINKSGDLISPIWNNVFITTLYQSRHPEQYKGATKKEIDSTGYTWEDLAKIEYVFETSGRKIQDRGERMYNGLMSVVEVLGQIHEVEKETTEETKKLFVKA